MANLHWVENPEEEVARRQQEQEELLKRKQEVEEKEAAFYRKNINTPILIAAILGWVWVLLWLIATVGGGYTDDGTFIAETLIVVVISIATIISLIGRKNNSLVMVIVAIVLYGLSVFGVISAILCIVAAVRMKKLMKKTTA